MKGKRIIVIGLMVIFLVCPIHTLLCQTETPTIILFAAYIFKAQTLGDDLTFPVMPPETSILTLDHFSETANGYIDNLKSIYAFSRFTLVDTRGGMFSISLKRGDGNYEVPIIFGEQKHLLYLNVEASAAQDNDRLSLRIEARLDTLTRPGDLYPSKEIIPLLETQCHIKRGHPVVIGRPFQENRKGKSAIFIVFTPFFRKLTDDGQYSGLIEDYRSVMEMTASKSDLNGKQVFQQIDRYMESHIRNFKGLPFPEILAPLSTQPPSSPPMSARRSDIPIFVYYDEPPRPIGGYRAIQNNLVYPAQARRENIEGRVLVWVKIDKTGKVVIARIMKSLGSEACDDASMEAIAKVKWEPAIHDGKPVDVWVCVPVEFRLN